MLPLHGHDPHPVSTLPADCLSAHTTLLSPAKHSKPGVGADCADLALLYAVLHSHLKSTGLSTRNRLFLQIYMMYCE